MTADTAAIRKKKRELAPHAFPLDWIVSAERAIETRTDIPQPEGNHGELLGDAKRKGIPVWREWA